MNQAAGHSPATTCEMRYAGKGRARTSVAVVSCDTMTLHDERGFNMGDCSRLLIDDGEPYRVRGRNATPLVAR